MSPARTAVGWLGLAAAPAFAAMALLTAAGGPDVGMCPAAHGPSALAGMAPMYALMSAFHAAPWFRLVSGLRRRAAASR